MAYLAALEPGVALVSSLRANTCCLHDTVNPVVSAGLSGVFHVLGDVAIAIGETTFNPELFDLPKQSFNFP